MPMDPLIRKLRRHLLAWLHRSRSDQVYFVRRLSYKDVKRATDGFHRIVYSNSHIVAYTAKFEDGSVSLVKEVKDFDQGNDIFYSEVQFLGRLHHRHLLSLKGFSVKHKRLLIFDNIENGSLKEHLNDPLKTPLNWTTRLQIALGVVAALEYLFLFIEQPLCHVSISSSNIMLDENFTAKLSDFGLLTCGNPVMMPFSKDDSLGQKSGNIIFQLGVLLLELVTGQSSEMEGSDLIQWIQESSFFSSIHKMIDPDLGDNYDSRELKNLLAVAKLCIKSREKPEFTIPQLFRYLQQKTRALAGFSIKENIPLKLTIDELQNGFDHDARPIGDVNTHYSSPTSQKALEAALNHRIMEEEWAADSISFLAYFIRTEILVSIVLNSIAMGSKGNIDMITFFLYILEVQENFLQPLFSHVRESDRQ